MFLLIVWNNLIYINIIQYSRLIIINPWKVSYQQNIIWIITYNITAIAMYIKLSNKDV